MLVNLISDFLNLLFCNDTFCNKFVCVACGLCWHRSDLFVHKGLREGRFIDFVVTIKAETNHIDKDIFFKLLPIFDHELGHSYNSFWIWCIYSQNRNSKWFHNISRVLKTTVIIRISRESNLIVRNNVNWSVAAEFRQFAQSECFIRCTLAWESRITVTLDVHYSALVTLAKQIVKFSASLSHPNRVLGLKMAWIVDHS